MRRLLLGALLVSAACKTTTPTQAPPPAAAAPSPPPAARFASDARPVPPGLALDAMNLQADPCEDFYAFACGNWIKNTEIPADRARWSRSFDVINEHNEQTLHGLLEAIATGTPPAGKYDAAKLGGLYGGCMDEAQHEASLPTLKTTLKKLGQVSTPQALATAVATLHADGIWALFSFSSNQDYDHAEQMVGEVDQNGLGLPDRDYYLSDNAKMKSVRDAYEAHAANVFGLLGETPAAAKTDAAAVVALETQMAKASLDRVARREPHTQHHPLNRAGLKSLAPGFDWDTYFKASGQGGLKGTINVTHPPFFEAVSTLGKTVKPTTWARYFALRYVDNRSLALPKTFEAENFRFTSAALTGQKEDPVRWKKCVRASDRLMGEALGVPYVDQTFGATGKEKSVAMVKAIEESFEANLGTLTWMDAPTRAKALEKARVIINKIGYPDVWRNYDSLKVDRKSFLASLDQANAFEHRRQLAKIGKPTDRAEWLMTPPTVNAYCNAQTNEITFPAGILQPPFFSKDASAAVNFGAIGVVVGHEFTHAFDDEGRLFDAKGNLADWWSPSSAAAFVTKTGCVKSQFDSYLAIDEVHVNGGLTLGENVADLGGLKLSYAALQRYLAANPTEARAETYRFNPAQQFYLGFAQSWCGKVRPEAARMRAQTDAHSPQFLRVLGPLRNLSTFQSAFQCPAGSKMTRPSGEACQVW